MGSNMKKCATTGSNMKKCATMGLNMKKCSTTGSNMKKMCNFRVEYEKNEKLWALI